MPNISVALLDTYGIECQNYGRVNVGWYLAEAVSHK